MPRNYICALDIGSSKIAASLAEFKKGRLCNIFWEIQPSKGVKKGNIVDSIDLVDSIARILKNLKNKSGIKIKFFYASISGDGITAKHSRAIIPLAERGNKVITSGDIKRAHDQAIILGSNIEEEILSHIPFNYAIDSNDNVINPLGLYSHKLEVDLYLVCIKLSYLETLTYAVNQAGYELKEMLFSGLATSEIVLSQKLNRGANIVCDIGSDITEILLFKDGALKQIEILPFGGNELVAQLASELKIPLDLAEDIKNSYGIIGDFNSSNPEREILLKKDNIYRPIKQRVVCDVLTAQAKDICQKLKGIIGRLVSPQEVKGFFVCGRTVLQDGFLETIENTLEIPVSVGKITNPEIISQINRYDAFSGQKYLSYLTSLGIIAREMHKRKPHFKDSASPFTNPILGVFNKAKELYEEYF